MPKRKNHVKYEVEYEDAPSGYVTFYNYKEPLMKFEPGYGYMGAIIFDGESDKIQCHFCGEWFGSLPPHLAREHNMNASEYKNTVGLLQTTALISESARTKLIASGLNKRLQNLRQRTVKGSTRSQETKDKIRATLIANGKKAEGENINGTCREQIIDRMINIYKREGKNFSIYKHFGGIKETIIKNYGTIKEACEIARIPYRTPGSTIKWENKKTEIKIYEEKRAINFIKEFITKFNKQPKKKNFTRNNGIAIYRKTIKTNKELTKLIKIAYKELPAHQDPERKTEYNKEKLIKILQDFEKINNRRPAPSDGRRRLIPYASNYVHYFGSWSKALKIAFP